MMAGFTETAGKRANVMDQFQVLCERHITRSDLQPMIEPGCNRANAKIIKLGRLTAF